MGSIDNRPHVVALPFPTQGHINPLMQFCQVLARKGFVITFVNTESNQTRMQHTKADEGLDIRYETVPDNLPVPSAEFDLFNGDNRGTFFGAADKMEPQFEQLLNDKISKQGPPVSCIISDLFIKWTGDVARRFGVPRIVFWSATATTLLIDYHFPQLLEHGNIPVEDPLSDKLVTCIPGLSPLPAWALPYYCRAEEAEFDPGFSRKIARTKVLKEASCLMINTVEELEHDALQAMKAINPNTVAIGPLLLLEEYVKEQQLGSPGRHDQPSLWKEDTRCLFWLDTHKPDSVLYVSFGSLATFTLEQAEELAAGLEMLGQPYLWALRPKAVKGLNEQDFEVFKRRVELSGGLLVSWAPQLEVLMHASTGGFLTHCGWNSTLESICAGVPMLCWPCVAEQNLNCKLIVEDWKVGLRFSNVAAGGIVGRDEFVHVVGKLMGDEGRQIRSNVKLLSDKVVKAVASPAGSTQKNLESFISKLGTS